MSQMQQQQEKKQEIQRPLQSLVSDLIEASVKLQNQVIILEVSAKAYIQKLNYSEEEYKKILESLIDQRVLIQRIAFQDEKNQTKVLNFTITYSQDQFKDENYLSNLIKTKIQQNILLNRDKIKIFYFEQQIYQQQFSNLLSDNEKDQIKQNEELQQELFHKIQEFENIEKISENKSKELDNQLKDLNKTIENSLVQNKQYKEDERQQFVNKQQLEQQLNNRKNENSNLEQKIISNKKEIEELTEKDKQQMNSLKTNKQLQEKQKILQEKEKEIKENQNEIQKIQNELQTIQNQVSNLQSSLESLENKYLDDYNEYLEYEKKIRIQRIFIANQEKQIEQYFFELNKLKISYGYETSHQQS